MDEILTRNLVQPKHCSELNTAARDFALRGSVDYYTLFTVYKNIFAFFTLGNKQAKAFL